MKALIAVLAFGLFAIPAYAQEDTATTQVVNEADPVVVFNEDPVVISTPDSDISSSDEDVATETDPAPEKDSNGSVVISKTNGGLSTSIENDVVENVADEVSGNDSGNNSGGSSGSKKKSSNIFTGLVLGVETFKFNNNLSFGMKNDDVKELQKRLRSEGFFNFPLDTGYFGPITLAAVKEYQASRGIWTTGFVGMITRAALNR